MRTLDECNRNGNGLAQKREGKRIREWQWERKQNALQTIELI